MEPDLSRREFYVIRRFSRSYFLLSFSVIMSGASVAAIEAGSMVHFLTWLYYFLAIFSKSSCFFLKKYASLDSCIMIWMPAPASVNDSFILF